MLTIESILELINNGELKISYTFLKTDHVIETLSTEIFVSEDIKSKSHKIFSENFMTDRLYITMGCIAKSHNFKKHPNRVNFQDTDYVFDLRETNNEITIEPGEVISVNSNERIVTGGRVAAYILPRLAVADAGLFYVPSYCDPHWDGLYQAVMVNFGKKPTTLRICEKIAICRFYHPDKEVDKNFKEHFVVHNHHYGQNWKSILEGNRDPIRPGKGHPKTNRKNIVLQKIQMFWFWSKEHLVPIIGITLLGVTTGLITTTKYVVDSFPKLEKRVESLEKNILSIPDSGKIVIQVPSDKNILHETIILNRDIDNVESVWIELLKGQHFINSITYELMKHNKNSIRITFIITVNKDIEQRGTASFKYLVVD